MEDDIFTKVIETVRGVPSEYDSTVENITGKILSQNNLKHAEILDRFVDEWNHSESPKDSIVIAWLLSDRFLGTGEPAVKTVFADRLLERIDPEDNRLNPERLQEWIRSVIFSDEESIETLRNALIASKQIPKTTSGKAVDVDKPKKELELLSANAAAVYELLKALPQYRGMKGQEILKALENQKQPIFIDQSTLTKNIIPELRPYGVRNKRGAGYYISK